MRTDTGNLTTVRIGVLGASGYAGIQQLRLSAAHPKLDIFHATEDAKEGVRSEASEILCAVVLRRGSTLKPG
jgi:N-acetyl-gamma-glutamylphosphate reductase